MNNRRDIDIKKYKALKLKALKRDSYKCVLCAAKSPTALHMHHIFRWADNYDLQFDIDNVVILCKPCHKMVTGHENSYVDVFKSYLFNINKNKPKASVSSIIYSIMNAYKEDEEDNKDA